VHSRKHQQQRSGTIEQSARPTMTWRGTFQTLWKFILPSTVWPGMNTTVRLNETMVQTFLCCMFESQSHKERERHHSLMPSRSLSPCPHNKAIVHDGSNSYRFHCVCGNSAVFQTQTLTSFSPSKNPAQSIYNKHVCELSSHRWSGTICDCISTYFHQICCHPNSFGRRWPTSSS
jgi:hypothetical protein